VADLEDLEFDQTERIISVLAFAPGPEKLCVISFEGTEELSALSRFRLEAVTKGRPLKPGEVLGQKLGVAIRYREEVREFHGIVSRFEVLRTSIRGFHLQLLELSPPAWLCTLNRRCRIYPQKASHEIVASVLSEASVAHDVKSIGDQREYWVQYGESDFNLCARLMEEDGQFFRFDHSTPDCKLIGGDGKSDYTAAAHEVLGDDLLESWQPIYRVGPSKFKHGAWDYQAVVSMEANANGLPLAQPLSLGEREVFEYPGRHETNGEGARLATTRMAEQEADLVWIAGTTTTPLLEVAGKFKVENLALDMPSGSSSDSYALIRVDHRARDASGMPFEGERGYDNSFTCIPADLDYRPPRITPRPFIRGPQTGIVVDTPDEQGRARVRFPWDADGMSRWVRVAQSWAYDKMGTQFLPRIGSEVVVEFLDGDPDHPIIVGMVFNGDKKPLYDTGPNNPDNKTQSGIRGANWGSSGVADTSNELRFDDKTGAEEIYIHAQRDFRRVIVNDETATVEQGNVNFTVQQGNVTEAVKTGDHSLKLDMGASTVEAMQSITLKVGQNSIVIDQTGVTVKGMMISIQGQVQVDVKATMVSVNGDGILTLKGGVTMIN
jgi:type VI secretion system secreted protein VgrG